MWKILIILAVLFVVFSVGSCAGESYEFPTKREVPLGVSEGFVQEIYEAAGGSKVVEKEEK